MTPKPPDTGFRPGRPPPEGWGHRAITADLHHQIGTGSLAAGAQLPSRSQLADLYGVSETTIKRALDPLYFTGQLHGRKGQGVYVAGPSGQHGAR